MMKTYGNFIDGRFTEGSRQESIAVLNPATEAQVSTVPNSGEAEVREAIGAASKAQAAWARKPAIERAGYLHKIANLLRANIEPLARVITEEQGKPLGLARVEVGFAAEYLDYTAQWARRIEGEIITSDRANENIFLFRKPIGVIAGILPWNFPFFLVARKMAPALITGSTVVIKPSEETPNNALEFARIVAESGLPAGVFNVVTGTGAAGKALSSDPRVGMITFTGSVETGSRIMAAAAANITKVNLELGGKAPAIVLHDADMDLAVEAVKNSRVVNSGQVCNCAERVYVDRRVADEFTTKLSAAMSKLSFGNPLENEAVDMGPLINRQGFEKVSNLVESAKRAGATAVTGGKRGQSKAGYYYEPTVMADCKHEMEIVTKEIFGPVVPVVVIDGLEQGIAYANDSELGLTSSIYTRNINSAMHACSELKFGETYINRENFEALQGFHAGWRKSGIGGTDGKHGLYEFMQTQVVYLQHAITPGS